MGVATIMVNTDNATPSPTMMDILPLVKSALGISRGKQTDDADLAYLAQIALAKYNELKPLVKHNQVTSVENQPSYTLPADCRVILDVAAPSQYGYYNDALFLPMIDTPSSSIFGYSDFAFRSPSERIVREGILNELDHYANSFTDWRVDGSPPLLYIYPNTIASGLAIKFIYVADHLNQSSDPNNPVWNTLPAGHWKYLITLMRWAQQMRYAEQLGTTMSMSEGGSKEAIQASWQFANRADRLIDEVARALGAYGGVAIRSDR